MIRQLFAATTLAVGVGVALAPVAAAQAHVPLPGFQPASESFVTPLDPDAWRPAPKWIIASPFGTVDIYCASYKSTICYQLDPAGNRHDLTSLNAYIPRLWVLNPVQS
ncbi:exported hypothetical protein [Rhodococcus sp. RD6.2]|jgi:hypothetical protein|uniref:hypothetical protein n=1 Tax=Rhodococcus sp. RD6.2 TaxID=260936 RepID=UPI00063B81D1|nr:hypothetical protein [Rhodococcus sp. RD6.2]CRK53311.1 exported hypothetical protein [Rhodococcus sp. RD6.2]